MDDFGWCPIAECAAPAEIDKVKNFGRCTHCNFIFCLTCKEKNHFFKKCPALAIQIKQNIKDSGKMGELKEKHLN